MESSQLHIARCNSCGKNISRGKEGATKLNNGGMIAHLWSLHKDFLAETELFFCFRYKDTFFDDPNNGAAAKERLIALIKNELEIDDSKPAVVERRSSSTSEPSTEPAKKSSIMEQIAKKIRLDKEQRVRWRIYLIGSI